jgi:hypothetical protein
MMTGQDFCRLPDLRHVPTCGAAVRCITADLDEGSAEDDWGTLRGVIDACLSRVPKSRPKASELVSPSTFEGVAFDEDRAPAFLKKNPGTHAAPTTATNLRASAPVALTRERDPNLRRWLAAARLDGLLDAVPALRTFMLPTLLRRSDQELQRVLGAKYSSPDGERLRILIDGCRSVGTR